MNLDILDENKFLDRIKNIFRKNKVEPKQIEPILNEPKPNDDYDEPTIEPEIEPEFDYEVETKINNLPLWKIYRFGDKNDPTDEVWYNTSELSIIWFEKTFGRFSAPYIQKYKDEGIFLDTLNTLIKKLGKFIHLNNIQQTYYDYMLDGYIFYKGFSNYYKGFQQLSYTKNGKVYFIILYNDNKLDLWKLKNDSYHLFMTKNISGQVKQNLDALNNTLRKDNFVRIISNKPKKYNKDYYIKNKLMWPE